MFFLRRLGSFCADLAKGFIATNLGWRFDDLKRHLDTRLIEVFASLETQHRATDEQPVYEAKNFWVAPLPPNKTGIAQFTYGHLAKWQSPLHLYSSLDNSVHGRYLQRVLRASNENVHLFALSQLPHSSLSDYQAGVIVVGNSDHMVPMLEHGLSISMLELVPRLLFYLHDICLHNVLMKAKGMTVSEYHNYLRALYADKWSTAISERQISWRLTDQLVSANIYGIRALRDAGAVEFVVNSAYAKGLVESDLGDTATGITVHTLFHPVFDPLNAAFNPQLRSSSGEFLVGTFGVPGRDKHTDEVILAVKQLRSKHSNIRLLISGYQAEEYLVSSPYRDCDWIDVSSHDTQAGFESELAKVDIAIQLRRRSLGESSGVVPTLLAYGIPTLVSKLGAFEEFGAACEAVDAKSASSVGGISRWIQSWMHALAEDNSDKLAQLRRHMGQYAQARSTSHFNERLHSILQDDQKS